jgi:hypothetical protein
MTHADTGDHLDWPRSVLLREPLDLLSAVPYLIGYLPSDSLVVVGVRRGQLYSSVRIGLPDPEHLAEAAAEVGVALHTHAVDAGLVVAYGVAERADPALAAVQLALHHLGITVIELLRADGGRYWSHLGHGPGCGCSAEGTPYDVTTSRVAAEATLAGWTYLPDRSAYEHQVLAAPAGDRSGMRTATLRASRRLFGPDASRRRVRGGLEKPPPSLVRAGAASLAAALRAVQGGRRLSDNEVARLSLLGSSPAVLSLAWTQVERDLDDVMAHRTVWLDVFRRAEREYSAGPGCLFANAAWVLGEGTLARLAVERVLTHHPTHRLAQLMLAALHHGVSRPATLSQPAVIVTSTMDKPVETPVRRRPAPRRRRRSSSRRGESRSA